MRTSRVHASDLDFISMNIKRPIINQRFGAVRMNLAVWLFIGCGLARVQATGTWTELATASPGPQINNMLLMNDGTVLAHDVNSSTHWYKLTPTSSGSYVNGTWSSVAAMNYSREYCSSQVLPDGRVFVAGGEYGSGGTNAEVYDPTANTWTMAPNTSGVNKFLDSCSEILPNGNVLVSPVAPASYGGTLIWNAANNTWSTGPTLYRGDDQDEACWVKLADDSILTIDPFGQNCERYIPASNKWVNDTSVPISMYGYGGELGPGILLPNGKVFYVGATNHTAIYTPSGTTSPGSWVVGPTIPNNLGGVDAPGAMMANGKILIAVCPDTGYTSPTSFYEYDYVSNTLTAAPSPGTGGASFIYSMLDLPDGTVLMSLENSHLYVYTPDGTPLAAGQPVINSVTANADGTYTLAGTQFNGISEGAAYGDDAQMRTDYPIVRLTNSSTSKVYYARTFGWSSTGVMTGTNVETTQMTMPTNLPAGTYSLVVTANGIASAPVSVQYPTSLTWDANTGTTGAQDGSGTWSSSAANWWNGSADGTWNNANPYIALFGSGGTAGTVTVVGQLTNTWLTFNATGSGAYNLYGPGTLNLSNGVQANASASLSTPLTVTLAASQTWLVGTGATLTVGAVIGDGGNGYGLTKIGAGTLTLSGTNTYGGATAINAGTLNANAPGALPPASSVSFNGATNATLNLGAAQTVTNLIFTNSIASPSITITGTAGALLSVSPANLVFAPFSGGNSLTVNMGGLNSFAYTNPAGTLAVPCYAGGAASAAGGTVAVTLAGGTNLIIANAVAVGDLGGAAGTTSASVLNLGQSNVLDVGTLGIGASASRSEGTVQFAAGLTNPVLALAGSAGAGSLANVSVGTHDSFEFSDHATDLLDTSGGTLNAQLGNITIGQENPAANTSGRGYGMGCTFKMGAGTLTAASLTLGSIGSAANATNYTIAIAAQFSLAAGTASITNITLGNNSLANPAGSTDNLTNSAIISLTNGASLAAAVIQTGSAASAATVTNQILLGGATLGNLAGGNLAVTNVNVILAGGTTNAIAITPGQTGTIGSVISGTGALAVSGGGTVTLAAANPYSGSTAVSAGTLRLAATGSLSNSTLLLLAANTLLDVSAVSGGFGLNANQTLGGSGAVNGSVTAAAGAQISPVLAGAPGTLVFSNALTLNGAGLTFELSTNPAGTNSLVQVLGTVTATGTNLVSLNYLGTSLGIGTYTLMTYPAHTGAGVFALNTAYRGVTLNTGATALTLSVTAGGNASLVWKGDGTANSWDVHVTQNWLNGGNGDYFYQGDTVTFNNTGSNSPAINLTTNLTPAAVTVNATQNYTFGGSGQLTGGMGLLMAGNSTLTINTTNSYTGGTTVTNGTVVVNGNQSAATGGWLMPINTAAATVNFAGGSRVVVAATNRVQIGSSPASGTASQVMNVTGTVTNNGPLLVARAGYLNLTNGGTWFQAGGMTDAPPAGSGYSAFLFVGSGSAFTYAGGTPIGLSPTSGSSGGAVLTVGGGTFTTGQGFTNGINPLSTSGTAQIVLTNNGSLVLAADIPELTSGVNVSGVPTISLGAGGGAINTAGFATTITNVIGGAGALTKLGAGVLTLGASNTYAGGTTVSAGSLVVNGSVGTNNLAVQTNGTLGGTGWVYGPVTLGGTVAPGGASVGTLNTGAQVWNAGATYLWQCNNATNSAGGDGLNITGGLGLVTVSNAYTIQVVTLTGSNTPGVVAGFADGGTNMWTLATASAGITNFNPGAFAVNAAGFSNAYTGTFAVTTNGNALVLVYTAAPVILVPPVLSGTGVYGGGVFTLSFSGVSGQTYRILMTTDLTVPLTNWTVLATGLFDTNTVDYIDGQATDAQRFYRIASP